MRLSGRRVYVTGGTGFIGRVVVRRFLEEGAHVTCLVRPKTDPAPLDRMGARVVRGDVTQPETLDLSGHDLAVHAAAWVGFGLPARKLDLFRRTNVEGTRHVVEAAVRDGVAKLVHVSSIAALGAPARLPATEETTRPETYASEYERTKTEAHRLALQAGLPTAVPMPGLVLGPEGPFAPLLRGLALGRVPALPGDDAVKGWVHVEDVADGVLLCALKGRGAYLLVDENLRTTELLVDALQEAGLPVPRMRVPSRLLLGAGSLVEASFKAVGRTPPISRELLKGLVTPMSYDSARARKDLGWRPRLVARLAEDLARMAGRAEGSEGPAEDTAPRPP